ncbi:MAG TPA: enoyl-CoA hydratase/isomerase family protein [Acidimicrobiales bacterium]
MTYETIRYHEEHGVGWVTLDRPEVHHAFNQPMQDELSGLWQSLRSNDDVRCVVLTASGDTAFCTGIDRADIPADGETVFDPYLWDDPGDKLGPKSNGCFTPVIAAVNGMACAGAFYLLGQVEFIIAADHVTFFDPHVTFGMAAIYEPTVMVPRMPYGEIARLTLLGSHERMSAQRAHAIGLVSEVVPAAELHEAARWAAEAIASQPARPLRTTVEALWRARQLGERAALDGAPALLHVGTSPEALAEGEATFRSGGRITPRVR